MTDDLHINEHLKINLRQLMLDFYDHTPEKVWPRILNMMLELNNEVEKKHKIPQQDRLTTKKIEEIRHFLFELWEHNKGRIENFGK